MKKGFEQKSWEHWLQTSESEASSRRSGLIDTVSLYDLLPIKPKQAFNILVQARFHTPNLIFLHFQVYK